MDIRDFYDEFAGRQMAVGVNDRHRAILGWLRRNGLRSHHRVLEVGCGVGTLTELLAAALPDGSTVAIDLSPVSVEAARSRLALAGNVTLIAADVLEADLKGPFDVVVLPDVIEHIPLKRHCELFERVASLVSVDGFVLLHYPNPHYLEWCRRHRPDALQVVDQPIHADVLMANAYRHGLYLDYFERYSIWIREGDYIAAVFRPASGVGEFTTLPQPQPSLVRRAANRAARGVRRLLRR